MIDIVVDDMTISIPFTFTEEDAIKHFNTKNDQMKAKILLNKKAIRIIKAEIKAEEGSR